MDRSWAQRDFQRQNVFGLGIDPVVYHGALAGKRSGPGCLTGLNRGTDGSREKHQQKSWVCHSLTGQSSNCVEDLSILNGAMVAIWGLCYPDMGSVSPCAHKVRKRHKRAILDSSVDTTGYLVTYVFGTPSCEEAHSTKHREFGDVEGANHSSQTGL